MRPKPGSPATFSPPPKTCKKKGKTGFPVQTKLRTNHGLEAKKAQPPKTTTLAHVARSTLPPPGCNKISAGRRRKKTRIPLGFVAKANPAMSPATASQRFDGFSFHSRRARRDPVE